MCQHEALPRYLVSSYDSDVCILQIAFQMSSPVGTQVHPTGSKSEVPSQGNKTAGSPKPLVKNAVTNKKAWQDSSLRNSNSLGHRVGLQVAAITGGFSSEEEDSDYEGGEDLNTPRGMTRSLGRKEMTSLVSASGVKANRYSNIIPVSERSAAYKELISSSQNSWQSTKQSPRHSAMKISDGSDTSPLQSTIKLNPFLQLDKQGKIQPSAFGVGERCRSIPAHTSVDATKKGSSPAHVPGSPTISGMSVQMRIKIWAEKEQESKAANAKLTHRRSLQAATLLGVNVENEASKENTAHSDDETIKNRSSAATYTRETRENVYEEIGDKTERCKIEEASSSSSETTSPAKSPKSKSKKKREKKGSPKSSKKVDSPDLNQKRSKWKIKSPLQKRKNKVKKESKNEEMSEDPVADSTPNQSRHLSYNRRPFTKKRKSTGNSREEDEPVDNVFSPVDVNPGEQVRLQELDSEDTTIPDELPSVFDKVETSPCTTTRNTPPRITTREDRSISREILSIIDSFGTIDENHPVDFVPEVHINNNEGDSESGK